MKMNRRELLAGLSAGLMVPMSSRAATGTRATQISIGEMQVQTLSDGNLNLPRSLLFSGLDPVAVDRILQTHGIPEGPMRPPINVTLLRHNDRVVLFDAGAGPSFQATAGRLLGALEAIGIATEVVTHVVFTHCHPDHLWGVLDDFEDLVFPNAEFLMGQVEWDYWFAPDLATTIPSERASMAVGARRRMELIEERVSLFRDGEEILPGVAAHATFGHTPGHMSFELRDGGQSLMIIGDAIGNNHVSFAQPGWPIGTDQDPHAAAQTRIRLLDMMAHEKKLLIGYHFLNGELGCVESSERGYRFVAER